MFNHRDYAFEVVTMPKTYKKRWSIAATPKDGILIRRLLGTRDYDTTLEAYNAAKDWIDRQIADAAAKRDAR